MPLHQNQDGTWQWGKSGKKYKKKEDAIKQMKAIFANGYVEKHASFVDAFPSENFVDMAYSKTMKAPHYLIRAGYKRDPVYGVYHSTLSPLQTDKAIYGGDQLADKALQQRYAWTQKRRADLAGQPYNKKNWYLVPYKSIFNPHAPWKAQTSKPFSSQYKVISDAPGRRAYADWYQATLQRAPGSLPYHTNSFDRFLHQLGHTLTMGNNPGGAFSGFKIFTRALQGDKGQQADTLSGAKRYNLPYHPANGYYNSATQAATGLHQLFSYAASHGKAFKNWNELLPWMINQNYIVKHKNGNLYQGRPLIGLSTLRSGLGDFLRMQNYLRGLQRKSRRTQQEQTQLQESRRHLNLLSEVADTKSVSPQHKVPTQVSPNYIEYGEGQTKAAALNGNTYNDINNKGSLYMTYKDVYRMFKTAAPTVAKPAVSAPRKQPVKVPAKPVTTTSADPINDHYDPRYVAKPRDTVDGLYYTHADRRTLDLPAWRKIFKGMNNLDDKYTLYAGRPYFIPGR